MEINLFQENPFETGRDPVNVDEFTFWLIYLNQMQVSKGKFLTDRETQVLAYVLSKDPSITYFKKPFIDEMANDLGLTENSINQYRIKLATKGLLQADDVRGEHFLSKNLSSLQKYIRSKLNSNVKFIFNLNVGRDN